MEPRLRSLGKAALRTGVSAVALWIVFLQVDGTFIVNVLSRIHPGYLMAAVAAYLVSKVLSAARLNTYFKANAIALSGQANLRLYFVGMFYNLFLPGGIGGDGYKIWWLQREGKSTVTKAFQSVFFDRLSGMFSLAFLGFLFGWIAFPEAPWRNLLLAGMFLVVPALFLTHYFFARHFLGSISRTTAASLGVQTAQVLCAWLLLRALSIQDFTGAYLTVFLVSSLVAVLPVSIGGIGIRELVFITAAAITPIAQDASVAFSLLFFLVTAICSLPGAWITMEERR